MSVASVPTVSAADVIDAIDLSRHALVEASAGTGKTYTIEHLVLRLLRETPHLQLANLLLVTFTEKAAGELRQRIRRKIEQALSDDRDLAVWLQVKLRDALDNFDGATITTIHGFCHTLLKMFPFETGSLFRQELVEDQPLLEKLLRDQMRTHWPRRYGDRLGALLALSGFAADTDRFVRATVHLAQTIETDRARAVLIPDPCELEIDRLWQAASDAMLRLKRAVGPPPRLSSDYAHLNINQRTRTATIENVVVPLEEALARIGDPKNVLPALIPLANLLLCKKSSPAAAVAERLIPVKWLKSGPNLHACPGLPAITALLGELVPLLTRLSHLLTLNSVDQLRRDARALKRRNGWVSYQDMLTRVADFLDGEAAEAGIQVIRQRYRVAFVDEFQDTDAVQWRIFRRLFLCKSTQASDNRLFLIGDPKQAIYSFRGADVFTYLEARHHMQTLAATGEANLYGLAVNWRSAPLLVAAFNRIFVQEAWFGAPDPENPFQIGYTPVDSPDPDRLAGAMVSDPLGRAVFNVVDLSEAPSHSMAKAWLAGFIGREIQHLIGQGSISITHCDGADRFLNYGDIAILVRSQSEFAAIEPVLKASAIPYTYYRQPGLFQSLEAHWLSMVLHAVCYPQRSATVRMAMLTPFFDLCPAALATWPELPADHACQALLNRWHQYAVARRWGALFQSLMEDSGLAMRHSHTHGWARSVANLQQLLDHLAASTLSASLDIFELAALMDGLRRSDIHPGTNEDIHAVDAEGDKVQVMTMHMSKGLEFPVVFIAGGLTAPSGRGMHVYHLVDPEHPGQTVQKVIDLTGATGDRQVEKEREDEDKRLYYVSLTRAKGKLYIPYYPHIGKQAWRGPVCRFISPSVAAAFVDGSVPAANGWHRLTATLMPNPDPVRSETATPAVDLPSDRLLPMQTDFRHRRVALESFTSIGRLVDHGGDRRMAPSSFYPGNGVTRDNDEANASQPIGTVAPDQPEGLPGGADVGSMFHQIFEHIDFGTVHARAADLLTDDQARRVIDAAMSMYRIDAHWRPQIARTVSATLRAPLQANGSTFALGSLAPSQRRHEMEFFFPLAGPVSANVPVPGWDLSTGPCRGVVMRGFIDLVFKWQSRYYLADWKSNWLVDGYGAGAMAAAMTAAGYILQYRLYTVALLRWLRQQLGDRFDAQLHFGGVFYFFIRGMGPDGQSGIFHVPPEALLPIDALESTIRQQMTGIQW